METPARFGHGDQTPERLRSQFSRLLVGIAGHADRIVTEALAEVGARKYHFAVLAALDEFGSSSQAELSDRTGVYRSDLVATINELADAGHVRREPDPGDRRRNVVTMTEAGDERRERLAAILAGADEAILAPLEADEREQLTGLLRRLLGHLAGRG